MERNFELIVRDDGSVSSLADGKETTLREAIGIVAITLYEEFVQAKHEENHQRRERLEDNIILQSKVLDSLSIAYKALSNN